MLAALLFVHDDVYHVKALPVGGAVGRKAVTGLRFVVHLHARGLVVMEGAIEFAQLVGLQSVMLEDLG